MTEKPYLVVRIRLSMYDMMTMPYPTQDAVLSWIGEHGIDVTREFSWTDEPDSLHRVFTQTHTRELHDGH